MQTPSLYRRIEDEIKSYLSRKIEISPGVFYSQYKLINRIYKFRNRDLTGGEKINEDLSYNYYFDIISPRIDSEVKNLRFDTKNILVYSQNPSKDFAAVFLANASLKSWMAENGEDLKLKSAVEEFVANGNIIFKRVGGGYELCDLLDTYITNETAETIDETAIIERHGDLNASTLKKMKSWDQKVVDLVIKDLGNKSFKSSELSTDIESSEKKYEVFEYTGEVSEKEFNEIQGKKGGDPNNYFLAKVIVAGLRENKKGQKYTLFAEKLANKKMSDFYIDAHRGRYEGRFMRVGMVELLMDHQIRANEIGNQIAKGLDWASHVVFRTKDSKIMQNLRADLENGDVITGTEDLQQIQVRLQGFDQLIADWNRLMTDADRISNSFEVIRGESLPSGTPFRLGLLMDQNAGRLFTMLRQKITLPYKRVFREWVLPELIKGMKGKDVFRFTGDIELIDQLRDVMVESWYANNLIAIGPHTKEVAEAIKEEKREELRDQDPAIENTKKIWEGVLPRLFVTITGEAYVYNEMLQDLTQIVGLEQDPARIEWILDQIYKIRGIPVPPKAPVQPRAIDPSQADTLVTPLSEGNLGAEDAVTPPVE